MEPISASLGVIGSVTAILAALRFRSKRRERKALEREERPAQPNRCPNLKINDFAGSPDIDICFVHGLTGDATSTWTAYDTETNSNIFWPTEFLGKEDSLDDGRSLPRARVMLYSYETNVKSLSWLTERTLYHHASQLLKELTEARKGCSNRPLLFIVHSLGGMLVKSALIFSFFAARETSENTEGQPPNGDIYLSTCGVISFGTPQTFADDSLTELVDHLCHMPEYLGPGYEASTPKFEDFGRQSWKEDVRELQGKLKLYNPLAREIPEVFCFEANELGRYHRWALISTCAMTVPPKPDYVHSFSDIVPIQRNHVELAQFHNRDKTYWKVCESIEKFYSTSKRDLPLRRERYANGLDTTNVSGRVREAGFDVKSELPPKPRYIPRKSPESGNDYLDILHERLLKDRHAVLTGEPGLGKTTLALAYAYARKQEQDSAFSSIWWINASSELALESSFLKLAQELRAHYEMDGNLASKVAGHAEVFDNLLSIPNDHNHQFMDAHDRSHTVRAVLDWLSYPENKRWLLIFDDVEHSNAQHLHKYIPSFKNLKADRGYIIITSRNDNLEGLMQSWDQISLRDFKRSPPSQARWFGSASGDKDRPLPSAESREFFSKPIRVGSFNREESLTLIEKTYNEADVKGDEDRTIAREIADSVNDVPQDIAYMGAFISSSKSPERVSRKVRELVSTQEVEVPKKYSKWFDACVMLGPGPIPILLLVVSFNIGPEDVMDSLKQLQAMGCVWQKRTSEFEIPDLYGRPRRQVLEAVEPTAAKYAGLACNSLSSTAEYLKANNRENARLREDTEHILIRHIGTCLDHYRNYKQHAVEWACEWDILAELCEKYGLNEEAAILYRAGCGQTFAEPDTASQASQAVHNIRSDEMFIDVWHQSHTSPPAQTWNDSRQNARPGVLLQPEKKMETKTSRKLRCQLGLIRMQILLGQVKDIGKLPDEQGEHVMGPDERLRNIMQQVQDRHEPRYLELQIESLKRLILYKKQMEDWPDAVRSSHKLIDLLESTSGPSSADTIKAIQQLAEIHMDQADYQGAQPLLEQVLMASEQTFGKSDPRVISVLDLLAQAYREQGDLKRARKSYRRIVDASSERLVEDHIETAKAKVNLAYVYIMLGKGQTATDLLDDAIHAAELLGKKSAEYERMSKEKDRLLKMMEDRASPSTA